MVQDNEKELDKLEEKLKKKRKKLQNSEMMEALQEEFGTAPEVLEELPIDFPGVYLCI